MHLKHESAPPRGTHDHVRIDMLLKVRLSACPQRSPAPGERHVRSWKGPNLLIRPARGVVWGSKPWLLGSLLSYGGDPSCRGFVEVPRMMSAAVSLGPTQERKRVFEQAHPLALDLEMQHSAMHPASAHGQQNESPPRS